MHCTVHGCHDSVVVREPIPLCEADAARAVIAYGQAHLGKEQLPEADAVPEQPVADLTPAMARHVERAREWLAVEPHLSGADIGKRLGTGDSYGRRVKRAATD